MNRKKLLISLAMTMLSMAGLAADNLPALRVQGKNLVDANGKTVVLHGVMDTPNRFSRSSISPSLRMPSLTDSMSSYVHREYVLKTSVWATDTTAI